MKYFAMITIAAAVLTCACEEDKKIEAGDEPSVMVVPVKEVEVRVEDCWTRAGQTIVVTTLETEDQTVVMPNGVAVKMLKVKFADPATDIVHEFSIEPKNERAKYFHDVKGRKCILVLNRAALEQRKYYFSAIIPVDKK
jgi:hypothetical protein